MNSSTRTYFFPAPADTGSSRAVTLSSCLKKALKDVEVDKTKHLKEKFLSDLRKTREKYKGAVISRVTGDFQERLYDY